jgi:hypothetical protein
MNPTSADSSQVRRVSKARCAKGVMQRVFKVFNAWRENPASAGNWGRVEKKFGGAREDLLGLQRIVQSPRKRVHSATAVDLVFSKL